jgi:hypothetical protein
MEKPMDGTIQLQAAYSVKRPPANMGLSTTATFSNLRRSTQVGKGTFIRRAPTAR